MSSVRTPNAEQMLAINHEGGKILSAGAGSGKTFVIVEHIVKKLEKLKNETPKDQWQNIIPFYLPKIVLMTFTKKATAEMSIRIMNRIDGICDAAFNDEENQHNYEFWNIVRQYLSRLNVTTISAFCKQILSSGFVPEISQEVEILSNVEFKNKISNLYNAWFVTHNERLDQIVKSNSGAIVSAMVEVFSSPELRLMWKEEFKKTSAEEEIDFFLRYYLDKNELHSIFDEEIDLNADKKEVSKGWYGLLSGFDSVKKQNGSLTGRNFLEYSEYFLSIARAPVAAKAMNEEQVEQFSKIKEVFSLLRDKKINRDFKALLTDYDTYWKWVETLKNVYSFINENYFKEKGFAFSDFEYLVCLALRDESVCQKIKKNYDYFIVDEFQDTSSVQYEIIKNLVGDDYSKLFTVGDVKQAIYGFRGGELLVFKQCIDMLGEDNNIKLKSNFRSSSKVIEFNNELFDQVFPLGIEFTGADSHTVLMESQIVPESKEHTGRVEKVKSIVHGANTSRDIDLNQVEAQSLYAQIGDLLKEDKIKEVCVLYSKLNPSSYLLDLLIKNNVNFNAQVKVSFEEDPILNLFLRFIEIKLNQNDPKKIKSSKILIENLFDVMNIEASLDNVEKSFLQDLDILGLRLAFHKMIYSLGVSNSLYGENCKFVDSISKVCNEDLIKVYQLLSTESEEKYSIDLINGSVGKKVIIMTAHASKGLEFDAVCVGGIYSNGKNQGKRETTGKMPKSLRWKKAYNQKDFFKSPVYYYEAEYEKLKEFSESKRLLYVANTRAIEVFSWIDLWANIDNEEIELVEKSATSNHWIRAFKIFEDSRSLVTHKTIEVSCGDIDILDTSFLLKDSLGIVVNDEKLHVGVFAETSVTKLTHLAQCPFKFYLSNICKINPPELEVKSFFASDLEEDAEGVSEDAKEVFFSSKQRGTDIHYYLSKILLNEMDISKVPASDVAKITWTLNKATEIATDKIIISEKLIKFSFFGQMISGTPDLVFHNTDELVIWDFKTGNRHQDNEIGYWFQLYSYAYAYGKLKSFTPEKMITMSLVYVDDQVLETKEFSLSEITDFLYDNWSKTEFLNQANRAHCKYCEYRKLCHYNTSSAI